MWKYNGKAIRSGRGWVDAYGVQHPSSWLTWSDSEKTSKGLVWEDDPAPFDNRFYWSANNPKDVADLKIDWTAKTKATAGSLLAPTDWYVVRKAEDSTTTIPTDVATYRASVRTASNTIETAITNAADHTAFMALFDTPVDSEGNPIGNPPINNWPDEI